MPQIDKFSLMNMIRSEGKNFVPMFNDLVNSDQIGLSLEDCDNIVSPGVLHEAFSDIHQIGSILENNSLSGLQESTAANVTAQFRNVISTLLARTTMKAYEVEKTVWKELVTIEPTDQPIEVTTAGFTAGEYPETVVEGAEYGVGHLREKTVSVKVHKYGRRIALTKEVLRTKNSNAIVKAAKNIGAACAQFQDMIVLDVVMDKNSTAYNGGALYSLATYGNAPTTGAKITHALLEDAFEALWAMTADNTDISSSDSSLKDKFQARPIKIVPNTILVGTKAIFDTKRILKSTLESGTGDNDTNVLSDMGLKMLWSQHLDQGNSAAREDWFVGDPKKQFTYYENWPILIETDKTDAAFTRDIPFEQKVSFMGGVGATDTKFFYNGN